jgi:hypothetical protein
MPEVGKIRLGNTMVHEVPRGGGAANPDGEALLSADLTVLDEKTDRFIRDHMLAPFIPNDRDIVALPDEDRDGVALPLVPTLVKDLFADETKLPEHSRALANHLFESQVGGVSRRPAASEASE